MVLKAPCAEPLSEVVPKVLTPSLKVTLPVGMPALELTVAVKVTFVPGRAGLMSLAKTIVVPAGLMVKVLLVVSTL